MYLSIYVARLHLTDAAGLFCRRQTPICRFDNHLHPLFYCCSQGAEKHTETHTHTQTHVHQSLRLRIHFSLAFIYSPACLVRKKHLPCSPVSPLGGALPRCHQELVTRKAKHSSGRSLFFHFLPLSAFLPHSLPPPGRRCDVSLNAPLANFCHIYTQTIGVKIEPRPQLTLTHAIQHQAEAHATF